MFSTSPPAACQEKTSPPRVRLHSSPPGTLASACWSRLVMLAGMHPPAPSVFSLSVFSGENKNTFLPFFVTGLLQMCE